MHTITVAPTGLLAVLGVLVAVLWVWRAARRRARAAADAARAGVRVVSLAGRVLVAGCVLAGVQWVLITHPTGSAWPVVAALVLPDLLAGHVLVRALTVTTITPADTSRAGRGGRGGRGGA